LPRPRGRLAVFGAPTGGASGAARADGRVTRWTVDALAIAAVFAYSSRRAQQTAVMTIAGEDGGPEERRRRSDRVRRRGEAIVRIGGKEHRAAAGSLVMIPAEHPIT